MSTGTLSSSSSSSSSSSWSDEDIESFLMTMGILIVSSIIIWCFIVQPVRQKVGEGEADVGVGTGMVRRPMSGTPMNSHGTTAANNNDNSSLEEDGILAMIRQTTRVPPHYYSNGSNRMHDGVVPFRQTLASRYDSSLSSSELFQHRKDRARIFTKLFSPPSTKVPSRGSCMVISLQSSTTDTATDTDTNHDNTLRVILLLASFYNVFVLLHISSSSSTTMDTNDTNDKKKQECNLQQQLENNIPSSVLPSHRIVQTTSHVGRVAFCRQLPKQPDLVIDFEDIVSSQLTRFGFHVVISKHLGNDMLPETK